MGKLLIILGLMLVAAGILTLLAGKIGWIGKLPGDLIIKRDHFTLYLPLATCLLISIVISFIFWIFRK